ncbi:MAG: Hsp70 family protein [Clostridiales bacterium]|nr:Hsp70 family protein [Clostridiales bacterium]
MAIIGIDLGTTNSLACIWRNGSPVLIKNSLGSTITPSVVGVDDSNDIVVGDIAKERLITDPDKTASEFKRTLGTKRTYNVGANIFSSEQLSSLVLKKIKEDAETFLGEEVTEAIISVPAYFDDCRRSATKQAAEMSGLKVERLINEPSAAALAYMQKHGFEDGTYMVIDFGGGTLDVSMIDSFDSIMEILAVAGNNQLGGKDFNEAIYHRFLDENLLDENLLTAEQKASIYKTAETCKIALSSVPMSIMSVNINDKNYTLTLDNNSLIKIAHEVFEKIGEPVRRVLRDSHMNVSEVKDIILVGGSCKMPTVAAYVERLTGRKPCTDIDPDTAICVGAGIFAGMKNRNVDFKDVILTDICPFSLGTDVLDMRTREQIMDFIIQRNSMLPSSKTHEYFAASDNQTELRIVIYQGESIVPSNNIKLGELRLNCPPTPIHEFIASVRLTYDINGILVVDVTTSDKKTHSKVILSESNTMSEEELAKCKSQLDKLRLAPSGEEQYQLLIARAERIIEETLSFERRQITEALLSYKSCLKNGNERDIRIFTKKFARFLDQIEGKDTGLSDEEI